jgi:hypothetical protein
MNKIEAPLITDPGQLEKIRKLQDELQDLKNQEITIEDAPEIDNSNINITVLNYQNHIVIGFSRETSNLVLSRDDATKLAKTIMKRIKKPWKQF